MIQSGNWRRARDVVIRSGNWRVARDTVWELEGALDSARELEGSTRCR